MGGIFRDVNNNEQDRGIVGDDWWKTLVLYIFLNIARLLMVVVFYPFMKRTGDGLNMKESAILTWGGLRGALALALALIVAADEEDTEEFGKR